MDIYDTEITQSPHSAVQYYSSWYRAWRGLLIFAG